MAANFDRSDILRTAQLFHESGGVWELRIPKAGRSKTISGYFDKPAAFADAVVGLADEGFAGYYFTINPVKPDLFARSANKYEKWAENTTSDGDILKRRWLPIDLDPIRPAGISSSDEEHAAALQMAGEIRRWLIEDLGWPENAFIRADSGNGGHLSAKIDLSNDDGAKDLIKRCLAALDLRFSNETVKVDTTTYNAARIWKIYGTMARKGSDMPDRPHRLARLLEVPDDLQTVTREKLEALAAMLPRSEPTKSSNTFDPAKYAKGHGANVLRIEPWTDREGGTWELAILAECPFDSSHNRGEARIGVRSDGMRTFRCFHDSCNGRDWHALRDLWEPERRKANAEEPQGPTLEDALLFIAGRCDGAASTDGQGFNKLDATFGKAMAEKVRAGKRLSKQEYKDIHRMLKTYNVKQLIPAGMDVRLIPKELPENEDATPGEEAQPEIEAIPEDLQKAAMSIAKRGKPLKYMLNTFNTTHKGDKLHAESQFIGFGLQSAYNTKGVFDTWDGPSGKGKSDGAKACIRQLPAEYTIISSVTAKSLYRRAKDNGILPGSVLFLDDKNIEAGSDLEETLKRIQTFFQEGAEHETIDGKGGYLKTKLPPRLLVVRTYVDSSDSDEQLKNRSLDLGVDSSKETDKEVCDLVLKLGEEGQTTDIVTRRTLICRALWRDIKSHVYRVKMPALSQLVEFSDVSNRRNPSLFLDMIVGLACIHHRQRRTEDGPNGEKILYASYEDYKEAARLFNSQGDYLGTRLDKAERETVQYIKEQGIEGATISGIFSHLSSKFPNDGWNKQKVRRLMDGRPERENKGLADKVSGIDTRWQTNNEGSKSKVYAITGDPALGVQVTVHDPRTKIISSELLSQLSHRFPKMGKEVNDSNIPTIPTSYPKYPIKENGDKIDGHPSQEGLGEKIEKSSLHFGKSGKTGTSNESLDSEKALFPSGKFVGNDGKAGIGPHPCKNAFTLKAEVSQCGGQKPNNPKRLGTKKILSYSEMAGFVPHDTSSPEAETICRAARGQLMKGMAPRIEFLVKDTGLPKESIEGYMNSAPWIRRDDSSPAGIVVYLPVEAVTA